MGENVSSGGHVPEKLVNHFEENGRLTDANLVEWLDIPLSFAQSNLKPEDLIRLEELRTRVQKSRDVEGRARLDPSFPSGVSPVRITDMFSPEVVLGAETKLVSPVDESSDGVPDLTNEATQLTEPVDGIDFPPNLTEEERRAYRKQNAVAMDELMEKRRNEVIEKRQRAELEAEIKRNAEKEEANMQRLQRENAALERQSLVKASHVSATRSAWDEPLSKNHDLKVEGRSTPRDVVESQISQLEEVIAQNNSQLGFLKDQLLLRLGVAAKELNEPSAFISFGNRLRNRVNKERATVWKEYLDLLETTQANEDEADRLRKVLRDE